MTAKWSIPLGRAVETAARYGVDRRRMDLVNGINKALYEAALKQVDIMFSTPSDLIKDKDNRVDTGHMFGSVDVKEMSIDVGGKYTGAFGWLENIQGQHDSYFLIEDWGGFAKGINDYRKGLRLYPRGKNISPMHSLATTYYDFIGKIQDLV